MNAAMHGISRREALDRMHEIVEFAELDEFVDNPLRQYSSGMYLRLAFSVAINMQPDILLADEILAVGDIAFQERCLQRVAQEAERGLRCCSSRTTWPRSSRLCHRIIWLDKGEVVQDGEPEPVVAEYEEAALRGHGREAGFGERTGRHTNVVAEIASVRLLNALGEEIGAAPTTEDVYIRIRLKVRKPGAALARLRRRLREGGLSCSAPSRPRKSSPTAAACFDLIVRIPAHLLAETTYTVNVTVYTTLVKETKVVLDNALTFMAYGRRERVRSCKRGAIAPRLDWTVQSHVNARKKRKSVV